MPIIGIYFNLNLLLILISVVLTIVVLNFHFRGPKKHRVPKIWKKLIIDYLGHIMRITHDYEEKEVPQSVSKVTESREDTKNESFELLNETNTPNHEEFKRVRKLSTNKIETSIKELIGTLDVTKLKNNDLKIAILKEILLSQINLIDMSEKRCLTRKEASLNEIYDEWKILAIIIDRACFFIYLLTLISSLFVFVYIAINK